MRVRRGGGLCVTRSQSGPKCTRVAQEGYNSFSFILFEFPFTNLNLVFNFQFLLKFKVHGKFVFTFICSIPLNIVWIHFIYFSIYSILHRISSLALHIISNFLKCTFWVSFKFSTQLLFSYYSYLTYKIQFPI
jgi:hypothetical protein